jgi:hypothetical protein
VNLKGVHVMQVRAAEWYEDPLRDTKLPLVFTPLRWAGEFIPGGQTDKSQRARFRRRLEPIVAG